MRAQFDPQSTVRPPSIERIWNWTAIAAASILLVLASGLFFWGSDKGFDFTDEGLYLLVYQHPEEFPDSYTSYHRVGAVLASLLGGNIIALRLAGFLLTALATFYLSASVVAFVQARGVLLLTNRYERILLHLALQGSVLSAYCWLPPTPNYNTMAGIGMLLSCGGVLFFFSTLQHRNLILKSLLGIATMGSGVILAFLAKGSSAVGIVLISIILLGLCSLIRTKEKVILAVVSLATILTSGFFVIILMPSLFASWEFFLGSIVALTEGSGAREIIVRHWHESIDFTMRHFRSFLLPIILALGVGVYSRLTIFEKLRDRQKYILLWLVSGVLASEVIVLIVRDVFSAGIQGRAKSFIGYTSLFLVILSLRIGIPGLAKSISPFRIAGFLVFLLWLAILPFVTAAGTTHKIFINALLHAAPISAAVLLLASSIDKDLRKSIVVPFATLLLVCMGFSQFVDGFLVTPYRTAPKWTQTVPVKVGVPATILKLDPESAECIEKTKRALESAGFQPGDDVLALYGLPGLVYAVGGVSPQRPWFFVYGTPGHEENLGALQRISRNRFQKSYVFLNDKNDVAMSQLTICGFSLKEQWQNVGDVKVPFKNQTFGIFKPSH